MALRPRGQERPLPSCLHSAETLRPGKAAAQLCAETPRYVRHPSPVPAMRRDLASLLSCLPELPEPSRQGWCWLLLG